MLHFAETSARHSPKVRSPTLELRRTIVVLVVVVIIVVLSLMIAIVLVAEIDVHSCDARPFCP